MNLVRLFNYDHLLLVDLSSNGLSFYLAKDVKELFSIDFANLILLKNISTDALCSENLLSDELVFKNLLLENLKLLDLERYALVFLVSPDISDLEKKIISENGPFLKQISFVERQFFYNFYLTQKRNFSQIKFIVNLFDDCAELSCFNQEKLLATQKVLLRHLALESKHFFIQTKEKFAFARPDCFYFFSNNLVKHKTISDLAKYLKLEAIEVKALC
jgi:hypothetical protein